MSRRSTRLIAFEEKFKRQRSIHFSRLASPTPAPSVFPSELRSLTPSLKRMRSPSVASQFVNFSRLVPLPQKIIRLRRRTALRSSNHLLLPPPDLVEAGHDNDPRHSQSDTGPVESTTLMEQTIDPLHPQNIEGDSEHNMVAVVAQINYSG